MKFLRPAWLLALAALLPLVILSASLGTAWLRQQHAAMEQDALARTDRIATAVARELTTQITLLRALAESPLLDGPVDRTVFTEAADRVRRMMPLWSVVALSDDAGNRLVETPELMPTATGKVVDLDSHVRAVARREAVIGAVRRGPRGRPAFAIRVPVIRDGRPVLVLSAVVMPDAVRDILFAAGLPQTWIGAVVDGDGNLAARTVGPATLIGEPASDSVRAARDRADEGIHESVTIEGLRTVSVFKVLPGTRWSVHVGIPRGVYRAPLVRAAWLLGTGAAVSLAMVAAMMWLLVREFRHRRREAVAREESERLEALGRLTGGVAHDFNNLLMVARAGADLIKRRKGDAAQVERIADSLIAAVERGAALTRQLLAFARRSEYRPVDLDLRQRAGGWADLLRQAVGAGINVSLALPESLWSVRTDPQALETALVNLAVNARDAMPSGGSLLVTATNVVMRGTRADAGLHGEFVSLNVQDTGHGIPAEVLGRIFEPFFTTKPAGKGTGLGLSQVFGFAKQSGGAVTVVSGPGRGATFTLFLPRSPNIAEPSASDPGIVVAVGGTRVLVVEDNAEVAQALEAMLDTAGYRPTVVTGAAAALAMLDGGLGVDVVLSDIMLGSGMSGLDLASEIRKRHASLPVVLMTGYSQALSVGAGRGFTILTKPFGVEDFTAALQSVGSRSQPDLGQGNIVQFPRA
ncbi:ATP-binding protein [Arenibaculum pallidiluteum]|uniref:ATP-binding protein n=1 Tax=Arenibaculum pallidiluteum TaxID=2812559 RepID=UPI001A977E67|nr:ATP-binding protein [Arenibaculum pallidiluteum]